MNATRPDDPLETSTAVVRPGDEISADLLQELAAAVAKTASRERLRKRVVGLLLLVGGVTAAAGALAGVGTAGGLPIVVFGALCMVPVLPLLLAWGVRNRALLNAAAAEAAVDHRLLAAAVRMVEKKDLGPSAALSMMLAQAKAGAR